MTTNTQTVGDALPTELKSGYSSTVLNLSLEDAQAIQQGDRPWPEGFTQSNADELTDIYNKSVEAGGDNQNPGGPWSA